MRGCGAVWGELTASWRAPLVGGERIALLLAGIVMILVLASACQPIQPVDSGTEATAQTGPIESSTPVVEEAVEATDAQADQASEVAADSGTAENVAIAQTEASTPVGEQGDDTSGASEALIAQGMEVYHAQYCGICHELAAAGTTGTFGPSHDGIGSTAALRIQDSRYHGNAKTPEEYIHESLVQPQIYIVEGYVGTSHSMPPYTHLSEEQIQALVAMLMSQK